MRQRNRRYRRYLRDRIIERRIQKASTWYVYPVGEEGRLSKFNLKCTCPRCRRMKFHDRLDRKKKARKDEKFQQESYEY